MTTPTPDASHEAVRPEVLQLNTVQDKAHPVDWVLLKDALSTVGKGVHLRVCVRVFVFCRDELHGSEYVCEV